MANYQAPSATRSSNDKRRVHTVSPSASPYLFEGSVVHSNNLEVPVAWQRRAVRSCCAHINRHVRHVVRQTPFLQSPISPEQGTAAKLSRHEIVTGHVVGKGGFSAVSLVQHIRLDPHVSSRLSKEENEARQLLANTCVDPITNQPRYVIKHLQERLLSSSPVSSTQQENDPATVTSLPTSCPAGASPRDATDDNNSDSVGGHVGNTSAFAAAAIDLILEGEYLRRLHHPNIVRLVGMPVLQGAEALRQEGRYDGFFLLLERVDMTLEDAMQAEMNEMQYHNQHQQQHEQHVPSSSLSTALDSKLEAGIQLANALAYLHSLGIVFRDLKPQNVGIVRSHRHIESYGQQDRVVLLDFGLCRQLPCYNDNDDEARECSNNEDTALSQARCGRRRQRSSSSLIREVYHMSAVGTRRYLAVEVVNSSRYNELADVYSWSLVMWEYLTLTRPFPNYDVAQHALHVCQQGERPDVVTLPIEIRHLLGQCWTEDLETRLSMDEVVALLTAIVRSHYYDRERLLHNRGVFLIDAAMDEDDDEGDAREDTIDLALDRALDEDMSLSISSLRHAQPVHTSSVAPSELHLKHHHAVSPLSWLLLPDDPQHKANLAMWNKLDCASVTTRSMSSYEEDDPYLKDGLGSSSHNFLDDSLALPRDGMLVVTSKRPRGSHPALTVCSPSSYGTHLTALSCGSSSSNASQHPLFDDSDDLASLNHHYHELSMSLVADPRVIASSPFDEGGTW